MRGEICWVASAGDPASKDTEGVVQMLNEVMDALENIVDGGVSVLAGTPAIDDTLVVTEGNDMLWDVEHSVDSVYQEF